MINVNSRLARETLIRFGYLFVDGASKLKLFYVFPSLKKLRVLIRFFSEVSGAPYEWAFRL